MYIIEKKIVVHAVKTAKVHVDPYVLWLIYAISYSRYLASAVGHWLDFLASNKVKNNIMLFIYH